MYKVCAAAQDVAVRHADLVPETFAVDVAAVERAVDADTRLVFLCSPGNPTARSLALADVERLAASPALRRCVVVVDEAYVDFSETPSAAPLVLRHPRLVVLHTLRRTGVSGALGAPRAETLLAGPRLLGSRARASARRSGRRRSSAT